MPKQLKEPIMFELKKDKKMSLEEKIKEIIDKHLTLDIDSDRIIHPATIHQIKDVLKANVLALLEDYAVIPKVKFELKETKNRHCPFKDGYCNDNCVFMEEGECLIKTLIIHLLFAGDVDSPLNIRMVQDAPLHVKTV